MKVFSVYNPKSPGEIIDLMIDSPLPIETLFKNSISIDFKNMKISISDILFLIKLKKCNGKEHVAV